MKKFSIFFSLILIVLQSCKSLPPTNPNVTELDNSSNLKLAPIPQDLSKYAHLKSGEVIPDHYIITIEDEKIKEYKKLKFNEYKDRKSEIKNYFNSLLSEIIKEDTISITELTYTFHSVLYGFAAKLNEIDLRRLKKDKRILSIKNDFLIKLGRIQDNPKIKKISLEQQYVPWGVKRVGGPFNGSLVPRLAWVIDSGIDLDHPDLNVNQNLSTYFVGNSANDCFNHGTLLAGIIAAKNNNIGVVGVAAGATVVSVRAFDCFGYSLASICINALQYVVDNGTPGDVINVSWGWQFNNPHLNANISYAIDNTASFGFFIAIAAGNDASNVDSYYPAGNVENINCYVLSAMDSLDNFATFSNYGNTIDFATPGVDIYSTSLGGGYTQADGTSFSAPHMAGMLLYYYNIVIPYLYKFEITGHVKNDFDTPADPIPALTNTIVENFNDHQIYDNQPAIWNTPYPYNYAPYDASGGNLHIGDNSVNPSNGMLACTHPISITTGGLYVSFNVKINFSVDADNWACFHMFKNNYTDVPINDGLWSQSGVFLTIRKNGEIKFRTPYYVIKTANYQPGFSLWRHVEIYYNNSSYLIYVDKNLVLQASNYSNVNNKYYGFYTKSANAFFDELIIRNTINP